MKTLSILLGLTFLLLVGCAENPNRLYRQPINITQEGEGHTVIVETSPVVEKVEDHDTSAEGSFKFDKDLIP